LTEAFTKKNNPTIINEVSSKVEGKTKEVMVDVYLGSEKSSEFSNSLNYISVIKLRLKVNVRY